MTVPRFSRRTVLRTAGGALAATVAGCIGGGGNDSTNEPDDTTNGSDDPPETERETHAMMEGTAYETSVHVLRAGDGPTGMVLGGVHGNETGGVEGARTVTEYDLAGGRLVVIPEANKPAVDEETRHGPDGDLNRQFPVGEAPTTGIARGLWDEITEYEPDCLIDMHTSRGIIGVDDGAVGQMIFPSSVEGATRDAATAAEYMNEEVMTAFLEENPEYAFQSGTVSGSEIEQSNEERLMAVMKAGADLGTTGWITEVTYKGLDLDQQAFLHDRLAVRLLAENGLEVESPLAGESFQSL
ncbi:M14 family metallopeptidase [Halalkalicoccus subterraneus]|uniref:succinylglutamate desuccinylase/aspartoacylase domain-containing protein n=1 Tax=Halalkalicoccus subterraneus TaxID=2675002 RepID=UPI000EFB8239|nr:succinylglutamate desuccinylase/aspartoacylase family protein [Halalkalicoccus subterraneus]